jgi:hypothetical protein
METMQRSECESDQPERYGHLCYGFVVQYRYGGRVRRCWASTDRNRKSLSRTASQRYAQVIDMTHTHLGAIGAMGSAFLFSASNHSTEPGCGTPPDSLLEGAGFELLVRGRVRLVVGRRRQRNRTARRSRCRCASVTFDQQGDFPLLIVKMSGLRHGTGGTAHERSAGRSGTAQLSDQSNGLERNRKFADSPLEEVG